MNWIRTIIIWSFLSYSMIGCSQNRIPSLEEARKDIQIAKYDTPRPGATIRYHIPENIDSIIHSNLDFEDRYFFACFESDSTTKISFYGQSITYSKDTSNIINLLLKSTNRHILIGDQQVPIFFPSDTKHTFAGFTFTGSVFFIEYTGVYPGTGTLVSYSPHE